MAADDHGSISTYSNHGCRCDLCKEAQRVYCAKQRQERRELMASGLAVLAVHGRDSTYLNYGCRCDSCTDAHSAKCREYRNKKRKTT